MLDYKFLILGSRWRFNVNNLILYFYISELVLQNQNRLHLNFSIYIDMNILIVFDVLIKIRFIDKYIYLNTKYMFVVLFYLRSALLLFDFDEEIDILFLYFNRFVLQKYTKPIFFFFDEYSSIKCLKLDEGYPVLASLIP